MTIATVATDIDLGANVDLTATAGNITANSGVTAINLSGAGTNKVTAGGDINLAAVADGANIAELEIQGEDITLAGIALNNGGTSLLDINLDGGADGGAKTLDINGDVNVVSLTVDGQTDDVINLGANADLTTTTSGIDLDNGIVGIVLDGAGSNLLTSAADISLAAVTDSAAIVELELNAQTGITLAGVELNDGGASLLDIDLDEGADGVGTVLDINGDVTVVSLTLDAQNDDVINLGANADLTATTSAIDLNNGIISIVLDGVGSNLFTSASDITLAAVTDSANIAELELNGENINLAAITLNDSGANLLDVNLDGATDGGVKTLALTGNLLVGTMTLDGQNSDDTITIPVDIDITASNGNLDLDNTIGAISLTGTAGENEIKTTGGTGDISIGAVGNTGTASDLIVTTAAGTTSGDITMNGAVTGVGYVTINAGSTTSGNTGDVTINASITAGDANAGKGIYIDATNDVSLAGTLTTTNGGTALAIDVDAANEFTLTSGGFDSDSDITITATADDVNLAAVVEADGNVDIDAGANIKQTAGNILAGGNVNLDAATTVDLDSTVGATTAIGGNFVIGATTTTASVDTAGAINVNGLITITGADITTNAAIRADADSSSNEALTLNATNGAANVLTVNNSLTTVGGAVALNAKDNVIFGASGAIASTTGNVAVTADSDTSGGGTGGSLTMATASTINAGSGTITLIADENVVLHGLTTTNNTANAVAVTSTSGSITEAGGATEITASSTNAVTTLTAKGSIGDNIEANPLADATNPLETQVWGLNVITNAAAGGSEIAVDNTLGSALTVTGMTPSAGQDASVYIKSSNGITVSAWSPSDNDNVALIATSGNITIPNGGTGVIDVNGNLENADISVGTGKVRLEAAAGFVQDSGTEALAIKASDLLLKANQLNSETDATDVGSITENFIPHLAVNLSGSLDVDINNASQTLTIVGANDGSNHSVDLKIADLDSDGNSITTNGGVLTAIVLNGTGIANHDDDDIVSPTLHLDTGIINTENANVNLIVAGNGVTNYGGNGQTEGSIQIDAGTSLVTDSTADDLGNINVNGNVVLNGTVHANTGETIALWGPSADIIITSAMVGANAVTLNPGGFDVILKPTGSLTVSGTTASLTISNTDELVLETGSGNSAIISVTDTDGGGGDVNLQGIRSVQMQAGTKITSTGNITIGDTTNGGNSVNYLYMANTAELIASGNVDIDIHHNESASVSDDTYLAFTDAGFVSVGKITSDNDAASGGDVFVHSYNSGTSGNIKLTGDINANANDVSLNSAGSITRSGSSSITATDTLSLTSDGDLGANGSYLTFVADNVTLNITGAGNDAYLNNTPTATDVTLQGSTSNGDIRYSQTGANLDVTGALSAGTGAIILSGSISDLEVQADVSVTTGSITISTDGAINLTGGDLIASGTGTISVTADNDSSGAGDVTITAVGTDDNEKIRTGSGSITIEGNNVVVDDYGILSTGTVSITATGGVYSSSAADNVADIEAGTLDIEAATVGQSGGNTLEFLATTKTDVESVGAVTITSTTNLPLGKVEITGGGGANVVVAATGNITDVDGTTADDIVNATNLSLSATTGIGSTGKTGSIEVDATTLLNVTNATSGGIFLNAKGTGGLTVTTLAANTAGNIEIYAEETIQVGSITAANGNVIISTDAAIDGITDDGTADISGTNITLTADAGGIGVTDILDLTATGVFAADSSDGNNNIIIDSIGAIALALIDAGSGNVTLDSTGAITDGNGGTNNITAGVLSITGNQAVTDIETAVDTLNLTTAATSINEADSLVAVLNTSGTTDLTAVTTLGLSGAVSGGSSDLTTNAAATTFGATTVGQNLDVTATGAVTDTGKLAVTGTTGITATGQIVTLDDATNEFGGTVNNLPLERPP